MGRAIKGNSGLAREDLFITAKLRNTLILHPMKSAQAALEESLNQNQSLDYVDLCSFVAKSKHLFEKMMLGKQRNTEEFGGQWKYASCWQRFELWYWHFHLIIWKPSQTARVVRLLDKFVFFHKGLPKQRSHRSSRKHGIYQSLRDTFGQGELFQNEQVKKWLLNMERH